MPDHELGTKTIARINQSTTRNTTTKTGTVSAQGIKNGIDGIVAVKPKNGRNTARKIQTLFTIAILGAGRASLAPTGPIPGMIFGNFIGLLADYAGGAEKKSETITKSIIAYH